MFLPIEVFENVGLFDEINCPLLAADVEFQIRSARKGFGSLACPDIVITQHENTNYYRKLNFKTLLTGKGSPVHLAAYLAHGKTMFNGSINFALFGLCYHYRYMKGLVKAVFKSLIGERINAEKKIN